MEKLREKQRAFCLEYVKDYNATRAAIAAGYSRVSAHNTASRLMRCPHIRGHIEELKKEMVEDTKVTVEWIADQLTDIAIQAEKNSDRIKALELLGRYKSMFIDKQQVEHTGRVIQRIINVNPSRKK